MNRRILVVEDDPQMARVLEEGLEQENYAVTLAFTGWQGLEFARKGGFGVIVLDVMLPFLDGQTLARQLRATGDSTPILMLTALDSVTDIVAGLDAGAEDYLTKPFSFLELLARLRSLLRRGQALPRWLQFADLELDTASHIVCRAGEALALTKTEYLLLELLMRNAGQVTSREQMVKEVWGAGTAIERNSIDVHIKALRAKVDQGHPEKLIQTVRGFGYRLAAADLT